MQTHRLGLSGWVVALAMLAVSTVHAQGFCPTTITSPDPGPASQPCYWSVDGEAEKVLTQSDPMCTIPDGTSFRFSVAIENYRAAVCMMSSRSFEALTCDWGVLYGLYSCGKYVGDPSAKEQRRLPEKRVIVGPEGSSWCDGVSIECPSDAPYVFMVHPYFMPHGTLPAQVD